jgi:hypothetical protein
VAGPHRAGPPRLQRREEPTEALQREHQSEESQERRAAPVAGPGLPNSLRHAEHSDRRERQHEEHQRAEPGGLFGGRRCGHADPVATGVSARPPHSVHPPS